MNRRRFLLLTLILCLRPPVIAGAEEPRQLRVLTYNIHHGEGTDGKFDLPRLAGVIKQTKSDLVALQEVDRKTRRAGGVDQAAELGRLTGMHAVFGNAMDYSGGQYGEAILSRFPFVATKNHALPHTAGHETRAAITASVKPWENGPEILFVGTHLEHADRPLRLKQAEGLNGLFVEEGDRPVILAGDLNAVPDSPPMRALLPKWHDAAGADSAATWPSDSPSQRIDYILLRPAGAWRVVESKVIDEPVASDHRPLLVVLEYVGR